MSGYKWQGSGQHGGFVRQGNRARGVIGDRPRGLRLYDELKDESFYCESCGGFHPLRQHRECRKK